MDNLDHKITQLWQDIDTFIHEPVRLGILLLLRIHKTVSFIQIQKTLDVTPGNLNSHINKLIEKNYVHIEKKFINLRPKTLITLSSEGNKAIMLYIRKFKEIMKKIS
ncbi:MAG: hypothetical protein HeimC3_35380 [Candidatus Heimdallarchaeota archaeon LC_3]|nr:MAG: hypothetical protein HeimC3_35380 [Candidatus Heimdallarchaeota archaeon LC_3]